MNGTISAKPLITAQVADRLVVTSVVALPNGGVALVAPNGRYYGCQPDGSLHQDATSIDRYETAAILGNLAIYSPEGRAVYVFEFLSKVPNV
jgi:hypothetical protein